MNRLFTVIIFLLSAEALHAQTPLITDNLMMPKKDFGGGLFYGHDSWKNYWEGTLRRDNGNVGTVTTQSVSFMGAYGISKKVTVIAGVPYIWTKASSGTLTGLKGIQDLSLAGKYNFFRKEYEKSAISFIALGMVSFPVSNYSFDLLPLSIGLGSKNVAGRLTADYSYKSWFITGSAAYTWRSNVTLDRPSYYTDGHLTNSDEVKMPNMFDYIVRVGYKQPTWHVDLFYTQMNTLSGGDITRQNAPFVADRMNSSRIGVSTLVFVPKVKNLAVRVWGDYAFAGRNVGQSTAVFGGFVYRIGPRSTEN
jgi:hypothetical protein